MTYQHDVRIRYGECDMQKVVFNAHYMAYCDDAIDSWFRSALTPDGSGFESIGFDFMLKTATISWDGPLRFGDTAVLSCAISRWGSASFDATIVGSVGEEQRFTAAITYVSVEPGTTSPIRVPDLVRERLG